MALSQEQLEQLANSVGWLHSIDLGQGVVTKGDYPPAAQGAFFDTFAPDVRGKTVLDIGAWDGAYSFEAERRGAKRVVALDHFIWSLDPVGLHQYLAECKAKGIVPERYEQTPHWHPSELPGKRAFDIAHRALGSRVEVVVADFMKMDLDTIGAFDVVLFLGVLYHMENPLESLRRVAALTREVAIIETLAIVVPGFEHAPLCEFYETTEMNDDMSNWWGPNMKALEGMCRAAGFKRVEVIAGPQDPTAQQAQLPASFPTRLRESLTHLFSGSGITRKLRLSNWAEHPLPAGTQPGIHRARATVRALK